MLFGLVIFLQISEALYSCRWSRTNKYCLAFLSKDAISISFNVAHNVKWPDDEVDALLRKYGVHYSNIREVDFRENCNWAFNWGLEEARDASSLSVLRFSRRCAEWARRTGYCIDLPKAWTTETVVLNAEFCDEVRVSSALVETNRAPRADAVPVETVSMLNASLQRALSLYELAERERRLAVGQVERLENDLELCRASFNSTTELYYRRSRQLRRCRSTTGTRPDHQSAMIKQLFESFMDHLVKIVDGE
ncbi:hypothetical protein AAVH_00807 [Aphelenchoides avenae]|nr:hypothetical protein AAVH_00807 [Aphelenchus avenae]